MCKGKDRTLELKTLSKESLSSEREEVFLTDDERRDSKA